MPIYLTELLAKVPPVVETRVKRVREQSRSVLQEALRTECRLAMRTPEETEDNRPGAQVPVEVCPGHPAALEAVQFPDDFQLILLLSRYRLPLEQGFRGSSAIGTLRAEILRLNGGERWVGVTEAELEAVRAWTETLLRLLEKHDPLGVVLAVREDFLGVYQYDASDLLADEFSVNRASIKLYWCVIGLVSGWLGCSVEDLTIVVLAHELAHAYTQLGADIESKRWPAPIFARSESGLKEGLAQYYTDRVLRRLEKRYPGALKAYEAMLPRQPVVYRSHEAWVRDYSPESVRRAMLEVRRWQEGKLADFERRLDDAHRELHPNRP